MRFKILLSTLLVLFCSVSPLTAALTYSGEQTLWKDRVWQGEVLIDGVLTLAPGVTLSIRPGTVVRFTFRDSNGDGIGENAIFSQGIFKAEGSTDAPIRFTSALPNPFPGAWGAINMLMSEENNRVANAIFEYGYQSFHSHFSRAAIRDSIFRQNMRGLQFQESTVHIERCLIENNFNGLQFRNSRVRLRDLVVTGNNWGIRGVYNDLTLSNSRIENNRINGVNLRDSTLNVSNSTISGNRRGLYVQRSRLTLEKSLLVDNDEHGLYLEDVEGVVRGNRIGGNGRAGIRILGFSGDISNNDLSANGEYALQNDSSAAITLSGNWWGSADSAKIADLIRDVRDRPGGGAVHVTAPLKAAPTGLPEKQSGGL